MKTELENLICAALDVTSDLPPTRRSGLVTAIEEASDALQSNANAENGYPANIHFWSHVISEQVRKGDRELSDKDKERLSHALHYLHGLVSGDTVHPADVARVA